MSEVWRDDGELCGYVAQRGGRWEALTVFRARLGEHDDEVTARAHVLSGGLAALADLWTLIDGTSGEEQEARIQHASPAEVTVALGYYSLPGVPNLTIPISELVGGRWRLERRPPA